MTETIFVFDKNKCVGCGACSVACWNENGLQPRQWRTVYVPDGVHRPGSVFYYISMACNHCQEAPCLQNCPARAYRHDPVTGAVVHHPDRCIGCRYCTWACPYDAPKFRPEMGIIEKCTYCRDRLADGLKPACADQCPTGALDAVQTDWSAEEALASSPVPVKVGSKFKVIELRKPEGPEMDMSLFSEQQEPAGMKPAPAKISARQEMPLLLFSLISAAAVAVCATAMREISAFSGQVVILWAAVISGLLSLVHLGKKGRAGRSLLNLRRSWLSREILFFLLFYLTVAVDLFIADLPPYLIVATGALFLISIDLVYRLARWRWPLKIHSAETVLIALTLVFLLESWLAGFGVMVLLRLGLYVYRHLKMKTSNWNRPRIRIMAMLISCLALFVLDAFAWALIFFSLGEIIDRAQFYNELKVPDPGEELN